MTNEHPLISNRRVLVAAIREMTATAREHEQRGYDPLPYLMEATRLVLRLQTVQKDIEDHDLD